MSESVQGIEHAAGPVHPGPEDTEDQHDSGSERTDGEVVEGVEEEAPAPPSACETIVEAYKKKMKECMIVFPCRGSLPGNVGIAKASVEASKSKDRKGKLNGAPNVMCHAGEQAAFKLEYLVLQFGNYIVYGNGEGGEYLHAEAMQEMMKTAGKCTDNLDGNESSYNPIYQATNVGGNSNDPETTTARQMATMAGMAMAVAGLRHEALREL